MKQSEFIKKLKEMGIKATQKQLEQLSCYYQMLIEYNKLMNLTSIVEEGEVYLKHFYDSLTITKIVDLNNAENLCDVGSGAGFPGIVLKIFYPNLNITLIDSLAKRIKFLNEVIKELELKKIQAVHERIEDFAVKNRERYDVVTARAVAPINILLELSIPLVREKKYFIAMKGNIEKEKEYTETTKKLNVQEEKIMIFKLPIEESKRTLIKFKKIKKTKKTFPRKYSDIKKNPL